MGKKISEDHLPIEEPGRKELEKWYAMTEAQAMKRTDSWFKKEHPPGIRSPIEKWAAAQELKLWCEQYKRGEKAAVLEGLFLCTYNDLPLPRWCTMGYLSAYYKVRRYKSGSWDEVFGRPHKKGVHLEAKRDELMNRIKVYNKVTDMLKRTPEMPIDEHLFATVGSSLGICKTLANKYYYQMKNRFSAAKIEK